MEKYFRIGEVAHELGCSTEWLRDAETSGRIPLARRDYKGWRIYSQSDIEFLSEFLTRRYPEADKPN